MKRAIIVFGLLAALLVSLNGYAQEEYDEPDYGRMGRGMTGQGMMRQGMTGRGLISLDGLGSAGLFLQHADYLDLSESQITQLRGIQREQLQETSEPRTDLQVAQLELDELLDASTPNFSVIEDKVREVEELRTDLLVMNLEYAVNARNVLNADQRDLADDLTGRRRGGAGGRMNRPGMGGMGGRGGM